MATFWGRAAHSVIHNMLYVGIFPTRDFHMQLPRVIDPVKRTIVKIMNTKWWLIQNMIVIRNDARDSHQK